MHDKKCCVTHVSVEYSYFEVINYISSCVCVQCYAVTQRAQHMVQKEQSGKTAYVIQRILLKG